MRPSRVDPRRRSALAVSLAACLLLAGCTTQGGAAPAAPSTPDWRTATYTVTCDGVVQAGFRATLVNGAAQVPAAAARTQDYDSFDVKFEASATGDLTGDGVPDTAVLLRCSPQPSNAFLEEVQVFSGAAARLGTLPSPRSLRTASILAPLYDPAGLRIERGDIVAAMRVYGPRDTHAGGPSERMTVRWHWTGQRFVRVQARG